MAEIPTTDLAVLLKRAATHVMTQEERREQKISFTFGLLSHRSTLTKDDVRRIMQDQGL